MTFYLNATPEASVKSTTIFFYGQDSAPAQELAAAERKALRIGLTRDAATFDGDQELCDFVVVMPDVPGWVRGKIEAAYGEKVQGKAPAPEPAKPDPEPIRRSYPNAHPENFAEEESAIAKRGETIIEPTRRQRVKESVK